MFSKKSYKTSEKYLRAQKGQAQGLAWSFPDKQTLKPQLYGYKHPQLQENQVRIKILYFGVGDMDVELLKSKDYDVFVPGHQIVGVIEAVGSKVGMRKIGQNVGVGFIKASCKNCKNCWNGHEQLCKEVKNSLTISPDLGGFGTHVQVSADWAFPIPGNIPLAEAAPLFCAGLTAYNVVSTQFQKLKHEHNRKLRICILGMGAIGHMAVKFANHFGYSVTIFSHTPEKQQILRQNGVVFDEFLHESSQNYKKNEFKFDVVVISGDVPNNTVKQCVKMARRNGKICLISYFKGQVSITGSSMVVDQKQIKGIRTGTKDHMYKMLETVSYATSETNKSLLPICEHYSFMQFGTAFDKIKVNSAKFRGVVKVDDNILERFNKNQI